MNAPPPHHNQYQYHQQYPGGPPAGHGQYGGSWSHQQQPLARFAAERARATGGAVAAAQAPAKDDKTSPFVTTLHSHPGFQPQKIGKGLAGVSCSWHLTSITNVLNPVTAHLRFSTPFIHSVRSILIQINCVLRVRACRNRQSPQRSPSCRICGTRDASGTAWRQHTPTSSYGRSDGSSAACGATYRRPRKQSLSTNMRQKRWICQMIVFRLNFVIIFFLTSYPTLW